MWLKALSIINLTKSIYLCPVSGLSYISSNRHKFVRVAEYLTLTVFQDTEIVSSLKS